MAHQIYHSISSSKTFGGAPSDYWPLHSWMDQSKALVALASHRLFLHNEWGIMMVIKKFGEQYNGVSTKALAEQHILEDLRFIPTLEKCLALGRPFFHYKDYMAGDDIANIIKKYSLELQEDIFAITELVEILDSPYQLWQDDKSLNLTHCAWSCFLVEQIMGVIITTKNIPTRYLVERIILKRLGKLPSAESALAGIPVEGWQCANALKLSEKYKKEVIT